MEEQKLMAQFVEHTKSMIITLQANLLVQRSFMNIFPHVEIYIKLRNFEMGSNVSD